MKAVSLAEFKQLKMPAVKEGPCLRITGDGATVAYLVVNPQGPMKDKIEGLCSMIDASRGLT